VSNQRDQNVHFSSLTPHDSGPPVARSPNIKLHPPRQQTRHIPQANPRFVLPVQHAQFCALPFQACRRRGIVGVAGWGLVEDGHHFIGQPLAQLAVGGVMVVDEQGVHGGFADQLNVLHFPVTDQALGAPLIAVEFPGDAVFEEHTHQASEIPGAEPRLALNDQGVKGQVVAGED